MYYHKQYTPALPYFIILLNLHQRSKLTGNNQFRAMLTLFWHAISPETCNQRGCLLQAPSHSLWISLSQKDHFPVSSHRVGHLPWEQAIMHMETLISIHPRQQMLSSFVVWIHSSPCQGALHTGTERMVHSCLRSKFFAWLHGTFLATGSYLCHVPQCVWTWQVPWSVFSMGSNSPCHPPHVCSCFSETSQCLSISWVLSSQPHV